MPVDLQEAWKRACLIANDHISLCGRPTDKLLFFRVAMKEYFKYTRP